MSQNIKTESSLDGRRLQVADVTIRLWQSTKSQLDTIHASTGESYAEIVDRLLLEHYRTNTQKQLKQLQNKIQQK